MIKAALVGAFGLSVALIVPASSQAAGVSGRHVRAVQSERALSEGHIAQAKSMLTLRPDQESKWSRVAAALRAVPKDPSRQAASVRRVVAAARPLIGTMDAGQKQTAGMMVRALGFTQFASAL
jgi:hypothetical protein